MGPQTTEDQLEIPLVGEKLDIRKRSLMNAELALIVECCRFSFAKGDSMDVRLPRGDFDWTVFLTTARRHRVQGLVWRGLQQLDCAVPAAIAQALARDSTNIAQDGLRAAAESARLVESFSRAGVASLFVKGLTLGKLAYGDPFSKMSWDIDLLVRPSQLIAAAAELERLGYRLVLPASNGGSQVLRRWHRGRKESVWRNQPRRTSVELHTRLTDNPLLLPGIDLDSPRRLIEVSPGIALPTLAPDELFAYLCVHGASSAWFRLKWITDFAALINACSDEQIGHLYLRSQDLGAGRAAAQALLLANKFYGTRIDSLLRERLEADRINRWLVASASTLMTRDREPTDARFGTTIIHLTQFFLLPGVHFKLVELCRQVTDAAANRF